jgi:hypothetical protein
MRRSLAPLSRYIAANRIGKRILFAWQEPWTCPSDLVNLFAFDDEYAMGILSSSVHQEWARAQSSTLRVDIRYTPTSAFETFPWPPNPEPEKREAVARVSAETLRRRQEICVERQIGLTQLLNEVDEGAYSGLRRLLEDLDRAVVGAYGWPAEVAGDSQESNRRLLALNRQIASGDVGYAPFQAAPV